MENNKKKKIHLVPESTGIGFIGLIGLIIEAVFLLLVMALDVLPFKYIVAIVLVLALIDFAVMIMLGSRKKQTVIRIVGLIIAFMVMNVLVIGDYYVYSTYDTLQKISKYRATWEIYDVITLKGGSYDTVGSIEGQTVSVVDRESKQLNEAEERLITMSDVKYNKDKNLILVGNHIAASDGTTHDGIVLATKAEYNVLTKQISGFKENSQIIYKMKVKKRANDNPKAVDVTKDSFNVLISGKDIWGKLESDKSGLSDVNMVMTINPQTKEILLTSIPRDSYITLHSYGAKDKLTHSGIYGADETKQTIEDFLDIDINYEITVNFSMLVDLIDAIGGIDVYSDYDFTSAIHDCSYTKGWNHLDGKQALYFARERKAFLEGDMQRNKNQQKVLKATIEKVTSSRVIMTKYTQILDTVEDKMYTTLTDKDMKKLAKLTLNTMNTKWVVNTVNVTGGTGGAPCYSMGNQNLSCVFPSQESVDECKQAIHDTMYPVDNTKKKNKEDQSAGSTEETTTGTE